MNALTATGKRLFLTGDEAVARAALEAGVEVATGYPGNPGTKAITALIPLAQQYGMAVEWSVNEKVALEVATGAAWAGKRSFVGMKMSGVNVMADSLLSIAHSGINGALVIYAVDDVGVYYGMVEQDTRYYAQLTSLPLLMPASPEEAYAMTRIAFRVSEQTGAPVFVLSTTAVANAITAMKVGKIERDIHTRPAQFARNLAKFTKAAPQWCRDQHADTIKRLEQAGELFTTASEENGKPLVFTIPQGFSKTPIFPTPPKEKEGVCGDTPHPAKGRPPLGTLLYSTFEKPGSIPEQEEYAPSLATRRSGIIVAGVSYAYLQELRQRYPERFVDISLLKLGVVNPLPQREILDFLAHVDIALVLEELDPIIETQVMALIAEAGLKVEVSGKRNGVLPRVGDYSLELIESALAHLDELTGRPPVWVKLRAPENSAGMQEVPSLSNLKEDDDQKTSGIHRVRSNEVQFRSEVAALPRSLEFCPGCPHRMTYYALNRAIEQLGFTKDEVITTGDVGCTIIGMNAPLDACWTEVSMGASIGIAQGFKYAGIERPVLAAMGDGTFYHNGIAGLLNAVQSGVNLTLIILDNSKIAMTGMQPDPGTGRRTNGEPSVRADIAMLARGCGVEYVKRINPYELPKMIDALQNAMKYPGVSVVIAEAPCTMQGVLINEEPVQVDQETCLAGRGCEDMPCYHKVGCPSVLLSLEDVQPRLSIDTATCVACGLCVAACPFDAIKPIPRVKKEELVAGTEFAEVQLRYLLQD
ncbi:MAG TPA: indolepyruvate ferredoxin oxidoreductase subunit alpha [Ktedonobacteraceae bacterium]